MIIDPTLNEYASRLEDAGFTIYEPKGNGNYFRYSQVVDGQECFGYVQRAWTGTGRTYTHLMPIRPTIEHGANMTVPLATGLTVEAAKLVAKPVNRNDVVGTHSNWGDPAWDQLYTQRTTTFLPDAPLGGAEVTP